MIDNELSEEIKSIKSLLVAILIVLAVILLILLKGVPAEWTIDKWTNADAIGKIFQTSPKEPVVNFQTHLNYPKDEDEALRLYNERSLQNAASNRIYSYDELMQDDLKTKFLISKTAVKGYAQYLAYKNNKAFAISVSGASGWSGSERASPTLAMDEAVAYCERYMSATDKHCHIIDINGVFLGSD